MMYRFFSALTLLVVLATGAHADEVEVIQLRHRMADQLIPTLQPLLEPGGALTGMQSSLIIRSTRENIEQIRRVAQSLDTVQRRLMISVKQGLSGSVDRSGVSVSGRVDAGDASVGVGPSTREGVRARIVDSRSVLDDAFDSQVQAVDGMPAYIATGTSVPVPETNVTRMYNGRVIRDTTTEYRDITSGFYVVPRVIGNRVTLDISPQRDVPGPYGLGSANIQHLNTTASGRLGEWIELGGIAHYSGSQSRGTLSSRSSGEQSTRSIWVKVEELQ